MIGTQEKPIEIGELMNKKDKKQKRKKRTEKEAKLMNKVNAMPGTLQEGKEMRGGR